MKYRIPLLVFVLLVLAVPITASASTEQGYWTQGFHVGHGRDTSETHFAYSSRNTGTYNRIYRTSYRDSSDSVAEALYCQSFKIESPGVYLVSLRHHYLNGRLYADRIAGRHAKAWAQVNLVLKIWQGVWPGQSGHKFMKEVHTVVSDQAFDYPDSKYIMGPYDFYQQYTVTDVSKPLKVCGGQNTKTYVSKKGEAKADFGYWNSYNGYGTLAVERIR